jgi:hypothetical protein
MLLLNSGISTWCCSALKFSFFCAVNEYNFLNVLYCNPISEIFGAVKNSYYLSLVLWMNLNSFFGAVTSLIYSIWCCQRIRDFDLGAVNEVLDFFWGAVTKFTYWKQCCCGMEVSRFNAALNTIFFVWCC